MATSTSNSVLNTRVDALTRYILDTKPFHTKLLNSTSEVTFADALNLALIDGQPQHTIHHQNVWGSADIPSLMTVSDGTAASQYFVIPPTVMPRFSVLDTPGQTPIGDDQAIDAPTYPWSAQPSSSHQLGSNCIPVKLAITALNVNVITATTTNYIAIIAGNVDLAHAALYGISLVELELRVILGPTVVIDCTTGTFSAEITGTYSQGFMAPEPALPSFSSIELAGAYLYRNGFELWATTNTGRYAVPFHNGSRVRVNDVPVVFGVDYIVNSSREYIQFLAGRHPPENAQLAINLMNSDKLFISICDPFVQAKYGYDSLPYDEDPYDLSAQADQFILTVSDAVPGRNVITFVNLEPGTTKAVLSNVLIYPSQADGNIWSIVSTGFFSVSVQQIAPIVGPISAAIINEPFDNGLIAFTLTAPWTEYYFTQQADSYVAYDLLPFDDDPYDAPPDEADFWPALTTTSRYPSVQFNAIGELVQTPINGQLQYGFQLYTIPPRGSHIELRIEQAKQLNPRAQLTMQEHLNIVQLAGSNGSVAGVYSVDIYADHALVEEVKSIAINVGLLDENGNARVIESGEQRILE